MSVYIIPLGGQGSGKSTQIPIILDFLKPFGKIAYIATGELFRDEVEKGGDLGKKAKEYVLRGDLVPDEIVWEIVKERLDKIATDGVVFDGFPRDLPQAQILDNYLVESGNKINLVLFIDVPEKELVNRIVGRRICSECEHVYHVKYNPPKNPGVCDYDGTQLFQREDDANENVVRQRLKTFLDETKQLISYYEQKGVLRVINGDQSIPKVSGEILKVLEEESKAMLWT